MDGLTEKQLKSFRQSLTALREELLVLLEMSAESGDTVELDQTKVGRLSRMDAMQQQEMSNACRAGYQKRLKDVQLALSNIEQSGSGLCDPGSCEYGWCEHCGDAIDIRRLDAKPESRFCVGCQETAEQA
jgi:DnaK suppressor protein